MKFRILLLLFITFPVFSQVSVGSRHIGTSKNFANGVLEKFKNTETIFLLSNMYDKSEYEKVLNDSWNVTPYKIVELEAFAIEDYLSDKYSIAQLAGFKKIKTQGTQGSITSSYTYIDFKVYDGDEIFEKLNKLSPEKREEKKESIIDKNASNIARFYIFPKDDFIRTALTKEIPEIVNSLFTDDVFFNYKLGYLKNYFQKINSLIKNEEVYWLYGDDYLPEMKELAENTLYIPSYIGVKFNGWKLEDSNESDDHIQEIFKKYDYEYKIISDDDLSERIMNNCIT
jgi:hypothetical protein